MISTVKQPIVSICMPVYNGERSLRQALDSLLRQSFEGIELIISDNQSTDQTELICRQYVERDRRIQYIRQPVNIGALKNFECVLNAGCGEFFMWAACDDYWSETFVEQNLDWLKSHPDYVGSISNASNGGEVDPVKSGSTTIEGETAKARVIQLVSEKPGANARFYSLFRRAAFDGIDMERFFYWAGDWSIMIHVLKQGKLKCLDGPIGFEKNGSGGSSDTVGMMDCLRRSRWEYCFPYLHYSRCALAVTGWHPACLLTLLKLNFRAAKGYLRDRRKRKRDKV